MWSERHRLSFLNTHDNIWKIILFPIKWSELTDVSVTHGTIWKAVLEIIEQKNGISIPSYKTVPTQYKLDRSLVASLTSYRQILEHFLTAIHETRSLSYTNWNSRINKHNFWKRSLSFKSFIQASRINRSWSIFVQNGIVAMLVLF